MIFGVSGKHLFLLSQVQGLLSAGRGQAAPIFIVVTRVKAGI